MDDSEVLYAVDETIATVTLNAPDRLNALSEPMHGVRDRVPAVAHPNSGSHQRRATSGGAPAGHAAMKLPRSIEEDQPAQSTAR